MTGTVLSILRVSKTAIIRLDDGRGLTAAALDAIEVTLPASFCAALVTARAVSLPYVSHLGGRGWLGAPRALVVRSGLLGNLSCKSKVTCDGGFFFLDDEHDAVMLHAFLKQNEIQLMLNAISVTGEVCQVDSLQSAATTRPEK